MTENSVADHASVQSESTDSKRRGSEPMAGSATIKRPRGSPPKANATSGMFSVRTRPAEQRAIVEFARNTLGLSANEFILGAIRKLMPAYWISQGAGRPEICSKCGDVAVAQVDSIEQLKLEHQLACWDTRIYRYVCPDCGEINGGGIQSPTQAPMTDEHSPTKKPCIFCGKGPMKIEFIN
ncbi:MAG: hypothetical protein U0930_22790 [Pirellulales bacterium]